MKLSFFVLDFSINNKDSYLVFCYDETEKILISVSFAAAKKNVNAKQIFRCLKKIYKNSPSVTDILISKNFNKDSVQNNINQIISEFNQTSSVQTQTPALDVWNNKAFEEIMEKNLIDLKIQKNDGVEGNLYQLFPKDGTNMEVSDLLEIFRKEFNSKKKGQKITLAEENKNENDGTYINYLDTVFNLTRQLNDTHSKAFNSNKFWLKGILKNISDKIQHYQKENSILPKKNQEIKKEIIEFEALVQFYHQTFQEIQFKEDILKDYIDDETFATLISFAGIKEERKKREKISQLKLTYAALYLLKIPLKQVALLTKLQMQQLINGREILFKKSKLSFFGGWEHLISKDELQEAINIFFNEGRNMLSSSPKQPGHPMELRVYNTFVNKDLHYLCENNASLVKMNLKLTTQSFNNSKKIKFLEDLDEDEKGNQQKIKFLFS